MQTDYRPSELARLRDCPGSAAMIEQLALPQIESAYAFEGTELHGFVAKVLEGDLDVDDLDGAPLSAEQRRVIGECVTWAELVPSKILDGEVDTVKIEERATLAVTPVPGPPSAGNLWRLSGTPDFVAIRGERAVIADWKFGRNPVDGSAENIQIAAYAMLVALASGLKRVEAYIIQPRLGMRTESYGFTEFDNIRRTIDEIIERSRAPDAPLIPSPESCRYCPAFRGCPAVRQHLGIQVSDGEHPIAPTTADAAMWYDAAMLAEKWAEAVKSAVKGVVRDANGEGEIVPGLEIKSRKGRLMVNDTSLLYHKLSHVLGANEFTVACSVSIPKLAEAVALAQGLTVKAARIKVEELAAEALYCGPESETIARKKTK